MQDERGWYWHAEWLAVTGEFWRKGGNLRNGATPRRARGGMRRLLEMGRERLKGCWQEYFSWRILRQEEDSRRNYRIQ
jgi:hypothetical protein